MAKTRAQQNRAIRQEALREQLAAQKHVEHVIELLGKMEKLGSWDDIKASVEDDASDEALKAAAGARKFEVETLDKVISQRLKLVSKYLPDLKAVELEVGGELKTISSEPMSPEEWEAQHSESE